MKRTYLHLLLLVICGALVYANALSGPFIFDDIPAIGNNPDIRQLWPPDWAWPDSGLHAATNSRPLTSFTLALYYALNGFRVEGYHLVNIALHILCGLALYGVVRRLCGQIDRLVSRASELALASAVLWLVHPLNSQVVNYTIQRSESLMALCYLGTLYCFLRGVKAGWCWLVGAVACCALGMAAKEVMVSAPVAVLLCDGLFVSGSYLTALQRRAKFYAGLALSWLVLLRSLSTIPHGATIGFGRGVDVWTCPDEDGVVDLRQVAARCGAAGMTQVSVEGGRTLAAAALAGGAIDEVMIYLAPRFLGGDAIAAVGDLGIDRLETTPRLSGVRTKRLGEDILLTGKVVD